jgi:hypothetical protein
MALFNNVFKYVYNKKIQYPIFLKIKIYNNFLIIYHMYIRYKIHNMKLYNFFNPIFLSYKNTYV